MKRLFFILLLFSFVGCSSYKYGDYETGPDLIIENISIKVNYMDGRDQTGMPVQSGYKTLDITLRIKNIGTKPFNSPLYVASTNSKQDFLLNYFNSFNLVEPSPIFISPHEFVEVKFVKRVQRNSSNMKFQVNYNSVQEKIAEETNYFNNTYSVKY